MPGLVHAAHAEEGVCSETKQVSRQLHVVVLNCVHQSSPALNISEVDSRKRLEQNHRHLSIVCLRSQDQGRLLPVVELED